MDDHRSLGFPSEAQLNLVHPAIREVRTWTADSRNWVHYEPRSDDIIIATYPKCGTTWMQRIVGMLVLDSTEPIPLMEVSPWIDRRSDELLDDYLATINSQMHRRFLKSHMPFDSLPYYDEVKYIHVVRDGRDALMSWYHFSSAFPPEFLDRMDQNGLTDDLIGMPNPRVCKTVREEFHRWLTHSVCPGDQDGLPNHSFFRTTKSWWQQRDRENVLLVHFSDLKADLTGEMRRVADFLNTPVSDARMSEYVAAAGFAAMKKAGAKLLPVIGGKLKGGAGTFLRKGENQQWADQFDPADLALYEHKLDTLLSADCAEWVRFGRNGCV